MAYPSDFQTTQNSVIRRLRLHATTDLDKVKDWINQAYADIVVETECLQKRATMALTANASIYTLPASVIRINYIAIKGSGQSEYGPPLEETTVDKLLSLRRSGGGVSAYTGTPTHFCLVGLNQFELWPAPAAADTLLLYYVYLPTALSANGDIAVLQEPWNTRLLEYGALVEAADHMYVDKADRYFQLYDHWMGKFRGHLKLRGGGGVLQIPIEDGHIYVPHDPSMDVGV